ncbi:MAG TPA: RsmE family RNA methyltransferase [Candidatus Limnocylindria bacterium]|nr:RsmE family RNA methyltransferase [Candidatus Limnocylindria bacterium]
MNRFFVDDIGSDRFPLPASIAHQVARVLRLADGDEITLLDGTGSQARCRLEGGACVVVERGAAGGEPAHRLTICQALIKGDRLEEVVRHGTELGIAAFRLVVTERCVVRELSPRRVERLRVIAREAAEQSERGLIPAVHDTVPLGAVLEPGSVLLQERHDGVRLSALEPPRTVIIGPEGGFTPGEIEAADAAGVARAGLGPRILRSESVALAVAAVILSRSGDFA